MRTQSLLLSLVLAGCSQQIGTEPGDGGAGADANVPTKPAVDVVDAGAPSSDASTPSVGFPAGWLYTQGGGIYVSNGTTGTRWVGRGVNADDLYFCGYNGSMWMSNAESTLKTLVSNLLADWKPTFVRVSLGMNSYPSTAASWTSGNAATYKTPMTNIINAIGANPGTYVLVTLRSEKSMQEANANDATGLPTAATDATYVALVDTFATSSFVAFGVSNEPGGQTLSNATIRAAMDHAVAVIRAEEDKLGVPHHIVSVQGNNWTSDISFYAQTPLAHDNVVYEVHGYPPPSSSYTYANIPVIVGEYGNLPSSSAFFADLEAKQIPSLAWDFDPYSDCAPDLLTINQNASSLVPTTWGATVKAYLLQH